MTFKDNTFDCIVDTFGLEYYSNPYTALKEMKRVCKKDGYFFILANGLPENKFYSWFMRSTQPIELGKYGKFCVRNWDRIIEKNNFEVIQKRRFKNGSLYYYILKNIK